MSGQQIGSVIGAVIGNIILPGAGAFIGSVISAEVGQPFLDAPVEEGEHGAAAATEGEKR